MMKHQYCLKPNGARWQTGQKFWLLRAYAFINEVIVAEYYATRSGLAGMSKALPEDTTALKYVIIH